MAEVESVGGMAEAEVGSEVRMALAEVGNDTERQRQRLKMRSGRQ